MMKKAIMAIAALAAGMAAASEQTIGSTNVVVNIPSKAVIVSCQMRPTDPTVMDVVYRVESAAEKVKVRTLAFKDGVRDFAHVLRPETFIEGTETNLGDNVSANIEHRLSWKVTADWDASIGNVSFEVLTMASTTNSFVLPYMYRDEVRTGEREYYVFSPKLTISLFDEYSDAEQDLCRMNILFWFFACNDPSLVLENGVLFWEKTDGDAFLPLCAGDVCSIYVGHDYNYNGRYFYHDDSTGVKFPLADLHTYCNPKYLADSDYYLISHRKVFNAFVKEKFSQFQNVKWEIHFSCIQTTFR